METDTQTKNNLTYNSIAFSRVCSYIKKKQLSWFKIFLNSAFTDVYVLKYKIKAAYAVYRISYW